MPRAAHARSGGDWIVRELSQLPGRKGLKIWAPAVPGSRSLSKIFTGIRDQFRRT